MRVLILDAAGKEFVKLIVRLYRSVKHYGVKEMIGKQFMDSAVEAGRLASETEQCVSPELKSLKACKADEAVQKTLFLLDVMVESGYYPPRLAEPISELGAEMSRTLKLYIIVDTDYDEENYDPDGFNDDYIA